jgi:hypothetical protein
VEEFTAEPLAAVFGITAHVGLALISDALDLAYRLPQLWARVEALEIPAGRGRRIAQATSQLTLEQAAVVDAAPAPKAHKCGHWAIDKAIADATDSEAQEQTESLGLTGLHGRRCRVTRDGTQAMPPA